MSLILAMPFDGSGKSTCSVLHFSHATTRYHLNGSHSDSSMGEYWPEFVQGNGGPVLQLIDQLLRFVQQKNRARAIKMSPEKNRPCPERATAQPRCLTRKR